MTEPANLEHRVAALEGRMDTVSSEVAATRHLYAAHDRDLADLTVAVRANQAMLSALALQTTERFDAVDRRFDGIDRRLDGIDQRLDGMDRRFDGIDQRLDGMDRRLDGMDQRMDGMDRRFDGVDQRLDRVETTMIEGFAAVDEGFEAVDVGFAGVRSQLDQFAGVQQHVVTLLTTLIERDN